MFSGKMADQGRKSRNRGPFRIAEVFWSGCLMLAAGCGGDGNEPRENPGSRSGVGLRQAG